MCIVAYINANVHQSLNILPRLFTLSRKIQLKITKACYYWVPLQFMQWFAGTCAGQ